MTTSHADDRCDAKRLLAIARRDRDQGLGQLLEFHRSYLWLLARAQIDIHLQSRCNPSDLVQETFLDAHRDFGRFRGRSENEFLAWLRRILLHNLGRLVEHHLQAKRRSVRREVSLARVSESSALVDRALVSAGSSPSEQARRHENAVLLANRLAQLPPHYRDVIVFRNLEGLPFEETARKMGRPVGAVRMLWLRALDRLRALVREESRP